MRAVIFLLLCNIMLLGGCGAAKTSDWRIRSTAQDHFYVQRNFEAVYADVLKKLGDCNVSVSEKRITPLNGTAQIAQRSMGSYSLLVEIFRVEDDQTRVDVYASGRKRAQLPRHAAFAEAGCPR